MHCLSFSLNACAIVAPKVLQPLLVSHWYKRMTSTSTCRVLSWWTRQVHGYIYAEHRPHGISLSLLSAWMSQCCWRQQGNMVNVSYLLRPWPVCMQQPAGHTETASQPSALMYKSVEMSCQLKPKLPHLTQLPIGVLPRANWSPCPMTNVSSLNFSLIAKIDSILSTAFLLRFV